jgi:hypothetical protein
MLIILSLILFVSVYLYYTTQSVVAKTLIYYADAHGQLKKTALRTLLSRRSLSIENANNELNNVLYGDIQLQMTYFISQLLALPPDAHYRPFFSAEAQLSNIVIKHNETYVTLNMKSNTQLKQPDIDLLKYNIAYNFPFIKNSYIGINTIEVKSR